MSFLSTFLGHKWASWTTRQQWCSRRKRKLPLEPQTASFFTPPYNCCRETLDHQAPLGGRGKGYVQKLHHSLYLYNFMLQGHDGLSGARGPPGDQGPIGARGSPGLNGHGGEDGESVRMERYKITPALSMHEESTC